MSDDPEQQAETIIQRETGYRRDLREAEDMIIAANGDVNRMVIGLRRHTEAQRNMVMAEMIPSFRAALKPLLAESLEAVLTGIAELNTEFKRIGTIVNQLVVDMATSKEDRVLIHAELLALKDAFVKLDASFMEYQQGNKRAELDILKQQINTLQQQIDKHGTY